MTNNIIAQNYLSKGRITYQVVNKKPYLIDQSNINTKIIINDKKIIIKVDDIKDNFELKIKKIDYVDELKVFTLNENIYLIIKDKELTFVNLSTHMYTIFKLEKQ